MKHRSMLGLGESLAYFGRIISDELKTDPYELCKSLGLPDGFWLYFYRKSPDGAAEARNPDEYLENMCAAHTTLHIDLFREELQNCRWPMPSFDKVLERIESTPLLSALFHIADV